MEWSDPKLHPRQLFLLGRIRRFDPKVKMVEWSDPKPLDPEERTE